MAENNVTREENENVEQDYATLHDRWIFSRGKSSAFCLQFHSFIDRGILEVFVMIVHASWIVNFLLSIAVAVTCAVGDKALQIMTLQPLTKALLDNSIHGFVGLFSAIILLTDHIDKLHVAIACMMMSSLIDADHFVAARSFKLAVRYFALTSKLCSFID